MIYWEKWVEEEMKIAPDCGPLGYCQWGSPSHLLHEHAHACPSLFLHLHEGQDLPLLISSPVGHDSTHACAFWTNIQENICLKATSKWQFHKSANRWKGACLLLKWLIQSQTGRNGILCRKCANPVWREKDYILSLLLPLSEVEKGLILGQWGQCRICEEFFTPADSNCC